MTYIQRQLDIIEYTDVVLRSCMGDFNDYITRQVVHVLIHEFITSLQTFRGIEFRVICDHTNNPSYMIDKGYLVVDIDGYNIHRELSKRGMR